MILLRTLLVPLRASIPLGASLGAKRFTYGSPRGGYDPIISSMRSTGRPARRTTWRYLRPESTSRPTLRQDRHVRKVDHDRVLDSLGDLEGVLAHAFQVARLIELDADAPRRNLVTFQRERVDRELN